MTRTLPQIPDIVFSGMTPKVPTIGRAILNGLAHYLQDAGYNAPNPSPTYTDAFRFFALETKTVHEMLV